MSENRERGWRSFFMLLMIGVVAWRFWPVINTDRKDPETESLFWLVAVMFGLLVVFLSVLVVAGILDKDPFGLSGQDQEPPKKKLTPEERQARRGQQWLKRFHDKL